MHPLLAPGLLIPLLTIFLMQSVLAMASYAIPVIVPDAAAAIGLPANLVAGLVSVVYLTAMVSGLASAGLIRRFGAGRVFSGLLLVCALGTAAFALAHPVAAVLAAVLIGASTGPMNPSGSYVLGRISPLEWQPLVFSLKQCGTPMGGMLAGVLLPPLAAAWGWQWALAVIPAAALLLALGGGLLPRADPPTSRPGGSDASMGVGASLRLIASDPPLRRLALAGALYASAQVGLATYLVVYLWRDLGMTPAAAGLTFSVLHVAGIVARVGLGLIAGRHVRTASLLAGIGFVMGAGILLVASFTPAWPLAAVHAAVILVGASGNGWVGLFFAEAARLAPPGRIAAAAGGGQFCMYFGIFSGPLVAGAVITMLGSYQAAFLTLSAAAVLAAALMLRPAPRPGG
jgi:predicted MFS family arabinose efflux permease